MDDVKDFMNYMTIGFNQMRQENKPDYSRMTAKKLREATWLAIIMYDKAQAKEKAEKILNNLELVWWKR